MTGSKIPAKIATCLWYDGTGEDAATFYAATFPDSAVGNVTRSPTDTPSGKQGDSTPTGRTRYPGSTPR